MTLNSFTQFWWNHSICDNQQIFGAYGDIGPILCKLFSKNFMKRQMQRLRSTHIVKPLIKLHSILPIRPIMRIGHSFYMVSHIWWLYFGLLWLCILYKTDHAQLNMDFDFSIYMDNMENAKNDVMPGANWFTFQSDPLSPSHIVHMLGISNSFNWKFTCLSTWVTIKPVQNKSLLFRSIYYFWLNESILNFTLIKWRYNDSYPCRFRDFFLFTHLNYYIKHMINISLMNYYNCLTLYR